MANYAPFGNAIYGETLFGAPPSLSAYTTVSIIPIDYDALQIDWVPPNGIIGQILVRSAYGIPTSINDGTQLLNETVQATPQSFSAQYLDADLKSGHFYYYALFVQIVEQATPQIIEFLLAGTAQGLVLTDWGFGGTFQSWVPDWYLEMDAALGTAAQPLGPLVRYLNLIGYEMDWIRSEIESFVSFSNVEQISGALLPALGANYGMGYEPELGMTRSRVLVKNAVYLYKNRGTATGIAAAASAFSGYGAEVTIGKNLEIQLDDSAFDSSVGHWAATNNGTELSLVSVGTPISTFPSITPEHASYVPAALDLNTGAAGYLPPNNENVMVITAGMGYSWNYQGLAVWPPPRNSAAMVYDPGTSTVILFGGQYINSLGVYAPRQDMWSWNGTEWSQLFPAALPSARSSSMVYDPITSTVILFGGFNNNGTLNDTWSWNGTTWTELTPATSPPSRGYCSMAYDAQSETVILFGGYSDSVNLTNDTWSWNGTTWTELTPATSPSARSESAMAYDPLTETIILFGGLSNTGNGETLNDTWSWNGTTWTELTIPPANIPSVRFGVSMVYDPGMGSIIMFGGDSNNELFNSTWAWDGTQWDYISFDTLPSARVWSSIAYDAASGAVLLYGGARNNGTNLSDTWLGSFNSYPAALSTCTTTNATTLGIPIPPGTSSTITESAYFMPFPSATPTVREFFMQLDWYGANGILISSSIGSPALEIIGEWVRAHVSDPPPEGALTYGRTVQSYTDLSGDSHLMDAQQVEVNASPTSWEPPRDIKINLLPVRQNLVVNPVGLGGTTGWTPTNGTLAPSTAPVAWPAGTSSGFLLQSSVNTVVGATATVPANPDVNYTMSSYWMPVSSVRGVLIGVNFISAEESILASFSGYLQEVAHVFTQGWLINLPSPAGTVSAQIVFTINTPNIGEQHYFSATLFEPSPSLLPYFDANFSPATDYTFEGTPNESISDYYPQLETKLSRLATAMVDYVPIGSTFSLVTGAEAFANIDLAG